MYHPHHLPRVDEVEVELIARGIRGVDESGES